MSPVAKAALMISVESMSPMTMRVVWAFRRVRFRSPIRTSSGFLQPM